MTREAINELKKYTLGRKNTEKVEISVLQLNRIIKALEQEPKTGHWIFDEILDKHYYTVRNVSLWALIIGIIVLIVVRE